MVVDETFHYTITIEGNQCSNRNHQLLLYIRDEGGVGKSQVVKVIYIEFMILEKQPELLLAAPTYTAAANIGGVTVYGALSINNWVQNKKQKIVKAFMERINCIDH